MTIILDGTTGITTPAINSSGDLELPGGTANGVLYLNGSNVATSGSALVFDGTNLGIGASSPAAKLEVDGQEAIVALRVETSNTGISAGNYSEIQLADTGSIRSYWRNVRDGSGATIFSYNDNLRISQGSSEVGRFTLAGDLLVGTTSVTTGVSGTETTLCVKGNSSGKAAAFVAVNAAGTGTSFFGTGDSTVACYAGIATNHPLVFLTNNTERARITAGGAFLVGETSSEGVADAVIGFKGGQILRKYGTSIAINGTVDFTINPGGGGYIGFLAVANSADGNAAVRTYTTFSVFGRGTDSSIQQISTTTSGGGVTFTVTTPSNGVIRITNTSGSATNIQAYFFGGVST
jgi:hypothetical protein